MAKKILLILVIAAIGFVSYTFLTKEPYESEKFFSNQTFEKSDEHDLKFFKDPTSDKKIYAYSTRDPSFDLTLIRHEEGDERKIKVASTFFLKGQFEDPETTVKATYRNAKGELESKRIASKLRADYHPPHKATLFFLFSEEMSPQEFVTLFKQKDLKVLLDSALPLSHKEVSFTPEEAETYTNFVTHKMPDIEEDDVLNYDFVAKLVHFKTDS